MSPSDYYKHQRLTLRHLAGFASVSMHTTQSFKMADTTPKPSVISAASTKDLDQFLNTVDEFGKYICKLKYIGSQHKGKLS